MTATVVSFRWLDLLEKEYDKTFVDLDLLLGEVEEVEAGEWITHIRSKLGSLSSCFAQLAHKAQTIFQTNAKLEAELLNMRHELAESESDRRILREESHDMLMQLHASQLELHRSSSINDSLDEEDTEKIRERLEKELEEERVRRLSAEIPKEELVLLKRENESLRKHALTLQGELAGAKLTSKYLDKELAGRIQQIQLLTKELNGEQHEKLWRQLEAEIHLHRHKTVVRVCRTNNLHPKQTESKDVINGGSFPPPRPLRSQQHRLVTLYKTPNQSLGMSITGGRDHGVPILISVLHSDMPAGACQQLFVGDAILSVNGRSLKEASHSEAVEILSALEGEITLEVVFVSPDEEDEMSMSLDDPMAFRYRMFDDEVASVVSSLQLLQNGRLSRASIDSIRGSTDNIIDSPRPLADSVTEGEDMTGENLLNNPFGDVPAGDPDDDVSSIETGTEGIPPLQRCLSTGGGEDKDSDDSIETPFIETNGVNHVESLDNQEALELIKVAALTWPGVLRVPRNQWAVPSGTSIPGRVTQDGEATGEAPDQ